MKKRYRLTIVVIAKDEEKFRKSVESIYRCDYGKDRVFLSVFYYTKGGKYKEIVNSIAKQHLKSNIKFRVFYLSPKYGYPKPIAQKKWIGKILGKLGIELVKPYRIEKIRLHQIGFSIGSVRAKGKYIVYLTEDYEILPNFYMDTVKVLRENKSCHILIANVKRIGERVPAFLQSQKLDSGVVHSDKSVLRYLTESEFAKKIFVCKKSRNRAGIPKWVTYGISDERIMFENSISIWLDLYDGYFQENAVAQSIVSEEELEDFEELQTPVLRMAFYKDKVWNYSIDHGEKFDVTYLKEAYSEAMNSYYQRLLPIRDYYKETKKEDVAKRYDALINAFQAE